MSARVLQLYCPHMDVTVDNFIITPSMSHDNILVAIKAAPRAPREVFPHDINGEPLFDLEETPFNLDNVIHGERLLIGVEGYARIRPEPELEVVCTLRVMALIYAFEKDALYDAFKARKQTEGRGLEGGLQEEDMRKAIRDLYDAAGALGSTGPDTKDNKGIAGHGQNMDRFARAKGKENQAELDASALECLGEGAAATTMLSPRTRKLRAWMDT